jgi:hypothetical protein
MLRKGGPCSRARVREGLAADRLCLWAIVSVSRDCSGGEDVVLFMIFLVGVTYYHCVS